MFDCLSLYFDLRFFCFALHSCLHQIICPSMDSFLDETSYLPPENENWYLQKQHDRYVTLFIISWSMRIEAILISLVFWPCSFCYSIKATAMCVCYHCHCVPHPEMVLFHSLLTLKDKDLSSNFPTVNGLSSVPMQSLSFSSNKSFSNCGTTTATFLPNSDKDKAEWYWKMTFYQSLVSLPICLE